MTEKDLRAAFAALNKIIEEKTYLHLIERDKTVNFLVNGVLEKYFELEYVTDLLAPKIKHNIRLFMYLSVYAVKYSVVPYPVLMTEIGKALDGMGKGALRGFFTAVLAKVKDGAYELPKEGSPKAEIIKYNLPSWLLGMYRKEFPEKYGAIIEASERHRNHIVVFGDCPEVRLIAVEDSKYGYFIKDTQAADGLFRRGVITYMGLGSCAVAEAVGDCDGKSLLDVCAAPGGKSVYLAHKGAVVTACDIHPHRVELINKYAERTHVLVRTEVRDATVFCEEYAEKFDIVLADCPCSGFGVIDKKRDIMLNRTYDDILALAELQGKILNNVSSYVKKGGVLVYSTCTLFDKENGAVVRAFIDKHPEFVLEKIEDAPDNTGWVRYLPDGKGMEGFFVCRMRKN